jgi:hypothetical protein
MRHDYLQSLKAATSEPVHAGVDFALRKRIEWRRRTAFA